MVIVKIVIYEIVNSVKINVLGDVIWFIGLTLLAAMESYQPLTFTMFVCV